MKVKELIEKLQKVDQEKEIILYKEEFEQGRIFAEVVDFENIHSYYPNQLSTSLIICPKGKFHPYDFDSGNFIIHSDFESTDNWDLRCFLHDTGYFFVLYNYVYYN